MRRLCLKAGCGREQVYRGRCRTHARQRNRETSPNQALYNSKRWKMTRRRKLFDQWYCERDGCGAIATDVHHLQKPEDRPDLAFTMSNLQSLCHAHHSQETRREQGAIHGST